MRRACAEKWQVAVENVLAGGHHTLESIFLKNKGWVK